VTARGVRQCFVLAFLHVSTRRVFLSPCSFKPDQAWMQAQAEAFLAHAKEQNLPAAVVLRDHDSKFTGPFDGTLAAGGVRAKAVGFRSPNRNAYVERFVQAIGQECLDKFVVFGREHLDHVVAEYAEHYRAERPHQSKGNAPLVPSLPTASAPPEPTLGPIACRERLGGVLRHYYREPATAAA
jgi:putative transposase